MPSIASDAVATLVGPDWKRERPRYRALAEHLRRAITSGELPVGARLPAERELSSALGISRSTVIGAYGLLRESGRLVGRTGSGSYVAAPRPAARPTQLRELVGGHSRTDNGGHAAGSAINLSVSHPQPLEAELKSAIAAAAEAVGPLSGSVEYAPRGLPELRAALAGAFTRRGLPTTTRQILVTNGAQQAIALVAQLYVGAGDAAVLESPSYLGAIDAFRTRGARLVALPGTTAELDPAEIEALVRRVNPALAFLMPSCHTVTGALTPGETRRRMAELSDELRLPLIDDDTFAGLTFDEDATPPMAAYAEDAPIFTIGSTSKLFWNGLRVGWLRAPEALINRLARLKSGVDLCTSLVSQLVTLHLLERAEEIGAMRRAEIRDRLQLGGRLLAGSLPDWSWSPPRGGRSLWIQLPGGSAAEFVQVAQRHGVFAVPGGTLAPDAAHRDRLRMLFVQPPEMLAEGIARLALAWAAHHPGNGNHRSNARRPGAKGRRAADA